MQQTRLKVARLENWNWFWMEFQYYQRRAFPFFLVLFFTFLAIYWGWLVVFSGFIDWPRQNETLNPNL